MIKAILLSIVFTVSLFYLSAQSIYVSNACISGELILSKTDDVNGKPAYETTGTVDGISGTDVSISWLGDPDNLWVLSFDGQPYFYSSYTGNTVPTTSSATWQAVDGTSCSGSEQLIISNTSTLPVTIGYFSGVIENSAAVLSWNTYSEINNKGFTIQRSDNGYSWLNIGFKEGALHSNTEKKYSYTDLSFSGSQYYRLQQEDIEGNKSYSKTISLSTSDAENYKIKNNPSKAIFVISIPSGKDITVSVYNARGAKVFNQKVKSGNVPINLSGNSAGIYFLHVVNDGKLSTSKLIKE